MTLRERVVETLKSSRKSLDDLLVGFPDDKTTYQPAPAVNHALWIVGHLALTDDWFACKLDRGPSSLPTSYAKLFGTGSAIEPDTAYPSFEEVKVNLEAARKRLYTGVDDAPAERLEEKDPELGTDLLGGLFALACHEAWHCGQLGVLRRSLNLPSIYVPTS